jgi:hypothetical protein
MACYLCVALHPDCATVAEQCNRLRIAAVLKIAAACRRAGGYL